MNFNITNIRLDCCKCQNYTDKPGMLMKIFIFLVGWSNALF